MGYDSKCENNDIIIPPRNLQGLTCAKMFLNTTRVIDIYYINLISHSCFILKIRNAITVFISKYTQRYTGELGSLKAERAT